MMITNLVITNKIRLDNQKNTIRLDNQNKRNTDDMSFIKLKCKILRGIASILNGCIR